MQKTKMDEEIDVRRKWKKIKSSLKKNVKAAIRPE